MTAALLALMVAVFTVVSYAVLADRIEYSSVRRRQLDVWASLTALLCFSGIVYGGVETRLRPAVAPTPTQPAPATAAAPEDGRGGSVLDPPTVVALAPVRLLVATRPTTPAETLLDAPRELDPGAAISEDWDESEDPGLPAAGSNPPPPLAGLPSLPSPTAASQVIVATATGRPTDLGRAATPTPTVVLAQVTRAVAPRVPPTQTPRPQMPTATLAPEPLPSSTPSCGDPSAAQLALSDLSASADRDGSDLVVHFDAQVRNGAGFPMNLLDISAVALNQTAGSEQYGQARLSDIAVEPGAVIRLDGAVQLTKLPPPFGRTELCLSFVLDSCGQRAERTIRQCTTVRGF